MINNYLEWCESAFRPNIDFRGQDNFSNRYYGSFELFFQTINDGMEIWESCVESFYGLILLLSWIGLTREEIYTLKKSCYNISNNEIATDIRKYTSVDCRIINLCEHCSNIERYKNKNIPLISSDLMFRKMETAKSKKDDVININTIHHAFDKFNRVKNQKCTFNTIRKSGLFVYLHTLENQGVLNDSDSTATWSHHISIYFEKEIDNGVYLKQDYLTWRDIFCDNAVDIQIPIKL